jgi:phosphate-selective porin OprO/OprP
MLEERLGQLEREMQDLRRAGSGGGGTDELEARIAELEKITKKEQDGLFPYWKNGLKMDSADGAFKLAIFGRIQSDWQFWPDRGDEEVDEFFNDNKSQMNTGVEFRRARLGIGGTIYKNVEYKAEYDFAADSPEFTDVYIELKDPFCFGPNLRVGHFDEPVGFDHLSSSRNSFFVERNLAETFVPARNHGFMAQGLSMEDKLAYFLGVFRDSNAFGDDMNNDYNFEWAATGRVTGRPMVSEDGTEWIHLGLSMSSRVPSNDKVQYRSRPEVHQGPYFVDTGSYVADGVFLWGLEAVGAFGPFAFAGEYMQVSTDGVDKYSDGAFVDTQDHDFDVWSLQVGYMLTGESRPYDKKNAKWDKVLPRKNWGADGFGAVEVALRYSALDLNDGDIEGGDLSDWSLGINWYLNPNTKFMLGVVRGDRQDLPTVTAVQARFQVDW